MHKRTVVEDSCMVLVRWGKLVGAPERFTTARRVSDELLELFRALSTHEKQHSRQSALDVVLELGDVLFFSEKFDPHYEDWFGHVFRRCQSVLNTDPVRLYKAIKAVPVVKEVSHAEKDASYTQPIEVDGTWL